jgi:hypothetical protein
MRMFRLFFFHENQGAELLIRELNNNIMYNCGDGFETLSRMMTDYG